MKIQRLLLPAIIFALLFSLSGCTTLLSLSAGQTRTVQETDAKTGAVNSATQIVTYRFLLNFVRLGINHSIEADGSSIWIMNATSFISSPYEFDVLKIEIDGTMFFFDDLDKKPVNVLTESGRSSDTITYNDNPIFVQRGLKNLEDMYTIIPGMVEGMIAGENVTITIFTTQGNTLYDQPYKLSLKDREELQKLQQLAGVPVTPIPAALLPAKSAK